MRLPFRGDPLSRAAVVALAVLMTVGGVGWFSNVFGNPSALNAGPPLTGPGAGHWLGTDYLGRSVLARIVEGIRLTFLLATTAVLISAGIGVVLGMIAGYLRGAVDEIISRGADVLFSFPAILLAILISAIINPGSPSAVAAVVVVTLPVMIRVVRVATLAVAEQDFVIQSRIADAGLGRILFVHLLPNVAGASVVQAAYSISLGMLIESGISFLGLGVQPPGASLGSLLHEGSVYLAVAPWLVFGPGAVLATAILSVNLVGDGLRRAIDPLLR